MDTRALIAYAGRSLPCPRYYANDHSCDLLDITLTEMEVTDARARQSGVLLNSRPVRFAHVDVSDATAALFAQRAAPPGRDLQATVEVTNLFNKYYFPAKFDLTSAGTGTITGAPGPPLGWALTVKKRF